MMSVHHKAAVTEGDDEGVTWRARACSTDREAIALLRPEDAETLLQNGDRCRRPPPHAPPLYCYIGVGVGRQPECIAGMAVRTKSVELTAAVVVACRTLGRLSQAMSQWAWSRTAVPLVSNPG